MFEIDERVHYDMIFSRVVLQKVKEQLAARGSTTIRSLGRTFRLMDSLDGNRKLDKEEFYQGLLEQQVKLTREESAVHFSSHLVISLFSPFISIF